ncbi:c-type cytochrome [Roseibacillus ishigakijimensis]|uniref:Cytochrome c n=1 Tax=Roseibacillus ishigakijimensis TaxID=454146 RepID=A0A934RSW7_9BACT|nr:c-type cytochrome [Roseibacillus ishigakijimensis]MBK1835317.1 cytochrome c [Roseibacillus ishigakijimensis]
MSQFRLGLLRVFTSFSLGFTITSPAADLALGKAQFEVNCMACHQLDHMLVGPSMIEIATLYGEDQAGFLKWCLEPGRKRPNAVEMPAMTHVGEENLKAIHAYILKATEGKEEKKVERKNFDNYPSLEQRPIVQRFFMPESSPASIAVALPGGNGDINFCFDTDQCRLRYVWRNENFMTRWPYWQGNGNAITKLQGPVIYREDRSPFSPAKGTAEGTATPPRFLGYTLDEDGIPIFRYQWQGVTFTERITLNESGDGLLRELTHDEGTELEFSEPRQARSQANTTTFEVRW